MKERGKNITTIDQYLKICSKEAKERLESIRALIRKLAPEAQEKISYQIPTYYLNGNMVHFAAFRDHIGLYPTSSGVREFEEELKKYKHSRGSIQFPIDKPLPLGLIKRIVKYRMEESRRKGMKGKKRSRSGKEQTGRREPNKSLQQTP